MNKIGDVCKNENKYEQILRNGHRVKLGITSASDELDSHDVEC